MNINAGSSGGSGFSFESGFGIDYGFAEGGHVVGEGTGTSDSILARLSNGECVVDAATVKRYGNNFFERLKSGDIYNLRIPIPKFARGGAVGNIGASAISRGFETFSTNLGASLGANFNPSIHNVTELRFDGKQFNNMLDARTESYINNNMMRIVMQANRTGRIK